jgi:hypothetical protein
MQKEIITDNTIDNYVVISPTKPSFVFFPKEESQIIKGVDENLLTYVNIYDSSQYMPHGGINPSIDEYLAKKFIGKEPKFGTD